MSNRGKHMLGRKLSEETKAKISLALMGEKNPFYGKTHSLDVRRRLATAQTGRKHTEATKLKMSLSLKGRHPPNKGKSPSQETRKKISFANKGRVLGEETKKRMSFAHMGKKHSDITKEKLRQVNLGTTKPKWTEERREKFLDEKNTAWKGNEVGYVALHAWVVQRLGKPNTCWECGKTNLIGKKIHWANKSRTYQRNLSDWIRLCASCHKRYDLGKLTLKICV